MSGKVTNVCTMRVPRLFGSASALMPQTNKSRLRLVCFGANGKLVRLLSSSVGQYFHPEVYRGDHLQIMLFMLRRVVTGIVTSLVAEGAEEAEEAKKRCESGECAAALVPLQCAIVFWHLPSRALKAHMLLLGREGVAKDHNAAFELVKEGARLGCHHCQGVTAWCFFGGYGCGKDEARSLELARESSGKGSRYGQFVLGLFYQYGRGGTAQDRAQALALYRLAAAQNLDVAQCGLGYMYYEGDGVAKDYAEALRLYQQAAAQGYATALFNVALCYERGLGVSKNNVEAVLWYRRAQAAGESYAKDALRRFSA